MYLCGSKNKGLNYLRKNNFININSFINSFYRPIIVKVLRVIMYIMQNGNTDPESLCYTFKVVKSN